MARPRKLKPDYCRDKTTNRAFVTINGHKKYLGGWNTQASRDEYDRVVGEWIAAGRVVSTTTYSDASADGITVSILIAGFWEHVQRYYRMPDGSPTSEVDNMRQALRPVRKLYGDTLISKLGPLSLRALQEKMIGYGWCRTFINRQINRVRMCFKWGVGAELIPSTVYEALRTVPALRAGRSDAKESDPVKTGRGIPRGRNLLVSFPTSSGDGRVASSDRHEAGRGVHHARMRDRNAEG